MPSNSAPNTGKRRPLECLQRLAWGLWDTVPSQKRLQAHWRLKQKGSNKVHAILLNFKFNLTKSEGSEK